MRIGHIFLRAFGVISTAFLVACGAQVPECHEATVLEAMQRRIVATYNEKLPAGMQVGELANISIQATSATKLDKEIQTRFCKASIEVDFYKPKIQAAIDYGYSNSTYAMAQAHPLSNDEISDQIMIRDSVTPFLKPFLKNSVLSIPTEYQIQMQKGEAVLLTKIAVPEAQLEIISKGVVGLAKFQKRKAQTEDKTSTTQETPADQRLVMVNSMAMCTDEALCVDTTKGEYRVNAFGLSDTEKQLLASKTAICLRGVSKEGDLLYFETVTASCGR